MTRPFALVACSALLLTACNRKVDQDVGIADLRDIPGHFPAYEEPDDNPLNEAKWQLGRLLFFDPRFSNDGNISCASCHQPELAFSDSAAVSRGSEGAMGFRNTPSLINPSWQPRFHREGGITSLEAQVLAPVVEPHEFNRDPVELVEELAADALYRMLAQEGFGRPFDAYVMTRSLAAFERSLITGGSPWDRWLQGDDDALSPSALRGMTLFDDLECTGCHQGIWATDFATHNNGLYLEYADPGAYRLTFDSSDLGAFKTPSLRNLAFTAPYMFDGSLTTLDEVIDHYASGGMGHPNQDFRIRPRSLSSDERDDLKCFLISMSDSAFIDWASTLRP
jgi:cytochrome c peroxidase